MDVNLLIFHLRIKKEQWITITDSSMNPTLCSKNQVKIISADTYNKGDIVVFKREHHLVIHRIVYISEEEIYFKGDNNTYLDNDSRKDKIIGKVKGKFLFSQLIAYLSYSKLKKVEPKFNNWLIHCLCYMERFQRIIAHNLRVNIDN